MTTPFEVAPIMSSSPSARSFRAGAASTRPALRWADIFDSPLHDFPIRDEILFQFLPLTPGSDIIEVGPGSGFTAFRLAAHVRSITLLEVAPGAVEELRRALGHIPNIRFVCADVSAPNLAKQIKRKFHMAFGLDVFEYVKDPAACLRNLASLLCPGGELFLTFPNVPPPAGDGVTWFADLAVLEAMLERAGFTSWHICAVRPRRFATAAYAVLHEWPLRAYRRLRAGDKTVRPQIYEATWAFRHRERLVRFKAALHLFWTVLAWTLRVRGDVFVAGPVGDRPLGRQLVIQATR